MKKRAVKASLIVLEIVAILMAVGAAGLAFLFWRLGQAPVSLALLKPSIEFAAERRLPPEYQCDIGDIMLSRNSEHGGYTILLRRVAIYDGNLEEAASANGVSMAFALGDIIGGAMDPKTIVADGAKFRIIRNEAQSLKIPAVRSRKREPRFSFVSRFIDGAILEGSFSSAEMTGAEINFIDVASNRSWISNDASIVINRSPDGLIAAVNGVLQMEGTIASIEATANYKEQSGVITAELNGENFPLGDMLTTFYGEGANVVNAPVSGKAIVSFTAEGDVLASRFDARLDGGELILGERTAAIEHIEWTSTFDPARNEFMVERFDYDVEGNQGVITGAIDLEFGDDVRDPERVNFDLVGENVTVNVPGFFVAPLAIENAAIQGGYVVPDHRLALHQFDLSMLGVGLAGNLDIDMPENDGTGALAHPGLDGAASIDGALSPQTLLAIWPLGVAMGARDWIADRLTEAALENINASVALAPGSIGEDGKVPDEALTISFDVSAATANYIHNMTPITNGSGSGVLRGNSFELTVDEAQVGDVIIPGGEVVFPVLKPRWQPTYIRFRAEGASDAMLGIIDEEPLSLISRINLDPAQFRGEAKADIEIMRPNKRDVPPEDYRYRGTASFSEMTVSGFTGDLDLAGAAGDVVLEPRHVTISANAILSDAPLNVQWRQNFYAEDGPSTVRASGVIDSSTADLFGVATRQYVRGPVAVTADATGNVGAFDSLNINADFSDAVLSFEPLDWRKEAGAPATGIIEMTFTETGSAINKFSVIGDQINIAGNLAIDNLNGLQTASFENVYLEDAVDLSITADRDQGDTLRVTAAGNYLNAGPLIESFIEAGRASDNDDDGGWGNGISWTARIDQMAMRNSVVYRDASLDMLRDDQSLRALNFSASDANGAPLRVDLADPTDGAISRSIEARSSEIGDLLRGLLGLSSIDGGEGILRIDLGGPDDAEITGVVEARDMTVTNAPLLARVFSAGSLTGLASLVNDEGINLTYAYGKFGFEEGLLSINEFRATGPSVGLTADGAIATGAGGAISLNGAVAPVYQLNSALGNTPIIGDILVGKKGEGILALSYSVSGERASPDVFVNPLSALTPGIFRQLFQPSQQPIDGANDNETPAAEEVAQ